MPGQAGKLGLNYESSVDFGFGADFCGEVGEGPVWSVLAGFAHKSEGGLLA